MPARVPVCAPACADVCVRARVCVRVRLCARANRDLDDTTKCILLKNVNCL